MKLSRYAVPIEIELFPSVIFSAILREPVPGLEALTAGCSLRPGSYRRA